MNWLSLLSSHALGFGIAALMITTVSSSARLGDTGLQCSDRYGNAKSGQSIKAWDKSFPVLEGAIHRTYEYQGWKIRAAFLELDGPAVRVNYQKLTSSGNIQIKDYEVEAILKANTPDGTTWKAVAYNNPNSPNKGVTKVLEGIIVGSMGQKMWQRTDGAIAGSDQITVRLELPEAKRHEDQLKLQKEMKTRMAVPQF